MAKKPSITLTDEQVTLLSTMLGALQALAAANVIPATEEIDTEETDENDDAESGDAEEDSDDAEESDDSDDEESDDSDDEESDESEGPDKEDVRAVLKKLVATDKPAAIALLKKYKAKTLDDVDSDHYEALIKAIKKALK